MCQIDVSINYVTDNQVDNFIAVSGGSDWEEHHEKLAVELETWAPGSELQDYHNGYSQHLARNGADSRGESPEVRYW